MATPSDTDPTGQARNRRLAHAALRTRLRRSMTKVLREFRAIPRTHHTEQAPVNNADNIVYDYDMSVEEINNLPGSIAFTLNDELLNVSAAVVIAEVPPPDWYYLKFIETSYRQGTIRQVNSINRALPKLTTKEILRAEQIVLETVLFSPGYNQALSIEYASSWADIKSLSDTTARQVTRVITEGMRSGLSPDDITQQIRERFSVANSSAKRTAHTEINRAYNNAKMRIADVMAKELGLVSGVQHRSALLSTTRVGHARRHGNVYTAQEQLAWWATGINRIYCYCTVESVLLNDKGEIVV